MTTNTIHHLAAALMVFNGILQRPGIGPLYLSEAYDLDKAYPETYWPFANLPGVYIIYARDLTLIYIGKASMSATLGTRLGSHFKNSPDGSVIRPPGWGAAKFVQTVPLPRDHAFEAPAIEEYLLRELRTAENKQGAPV